MSSNEKSEPMKVCALTCVPTRRTFWKPGKKTYMTSLFSMRTPMPLRSPGALKRTRRLSRNLLEGGEVDLARRAVGLADEQLRLELAVGEVVHARRRPCRARRPRPRRPRRVPAVRSRRCQLRFSWTSTLLRSAGTSKHVSSADSNIESPASVPNRCMTGDLPSASTQNPSDTRTDRHHHDRADDARDLVGALAAQVPEVVHGEVGAGAGGDAGDQRGAEIDAARRAGP